MEVSKLRAAHLDVAQERLGGLAIESSCVMQCVANRRQTLCLTTTTTTTTTNNSGGGQLRVIEKREIDG